MTLVQETIEYSVNFILKYFQNFWNYYFKKMDAFLQISFLDKQERDDRICKHFVY
jgi:hypothetical protein